MMRDLPPRRRTPRSPWSQAIGERLTPVTLPEAWYVIVHPGVHVSTASVFQSPELTRNSPLITIRAFFEAGGRNDCEPVVRARYPEVAEVLDWLRRMAPAQLTGTGASVFVACASAGEAERLAAILLAHMEKTDDPQTEAFRKSLAAWHTGAKD